MTFSKNFENETMAGIFLAIKDGIQRDNWLERKTNVIILDEGAVIDDEPVESGGVGEVENDEE